MIVLIFDGVSKFLRGSCLMPSLAESIRRRMGFVQFGLSTLPLLMGPLSHPDHQFWGDVLSWSATFAIRGDQVVAHGRITDVYLLALAVHHHGRLPSFDSVSIPGSSLVDRALCI